MFVVGWSFLYFVAPSLAVFYEARAFNSDVSKWNTGAVTHMNRSKCTLSLPVVTPFAVVCYDNSSFIGSQFSHVLFFFVSVFYDTVPFLWFVVGWFFFSLMHPLLQCTIGVGSIGKQSNGILCHQRHHGRRRNNTKLWKFEW